MVDAFRVADYFSLVLKRGQLEEVTFTDNSLFVTTGRAELASGAIEVEEAAKLFANHDKQNGKSKPEPTALTDMLPLFADATENQNKPIPVVVSLVSLHQLDARHGAYQSGLLLVEAKLFRDGRIEPELATASSPWIPSDRLDSPSIPGRNVMVGALSSFWQYSRAELGAEVSQTQSLADALDLATRLFEKVAGESLEEYATKQGHRGELIQHELCYIKEFDRIDAVGGLLEVYDFLSREKKLPNTVERMAIGWQDHRPYETMIHQHDGLFEAAKKSCGSMSEGFPLADSQRRAVHAFLDPSGSEITAVSGPPGTGKTTMLQAIVANLLTRRAIEEGAPPLIVGTSTNNQAVTNIIASFASVTKEQSGSLDFRWLPKEQDGSALANQSLGSLAVYCPSAAKLDEAKSKYLVEQKDKSQTYTAHSSESYLAGAREAFVAHAHAYFGNANDIPGLQQQIHDALTEIDGYRIELLNTMQFQGRSKEYISLCNEVEEIPFLKDSGRVAELKECDSIERLDRKLDVTLRYAEFWLAVHYFEAQWLLTDDFIEPENRWKNTPNVMERYWWQAAALTPCFVMTVYQVPKYFKLFEKSGEPNRFDIGRIDLLIVDEAGQVDTPLGLPSFALAQRVLAVGDEKQLAPVWSIDEQTDGEVAHSAGIQSNEWREDLQRRGIACSSSSSLMRAASHASSWTYGRGTPGLFLAEHFRCHPDIIGFCNTLMYDDLLQAKRTADDSKLQELTPAFLWVDVPGSYDSRHGSSRNNQQEAQAIAQWIVANFAHFFEIYNSQELDPNERIAADALIGVVTPFSAQASLITQELKKAVKEAAASENLPDQLWKKVTWEPHIVYKGLKDRSSFSRPRTDRTVPKPGLSMQTPS
ncbi:hypothetical protein CQ018_01465 [Arthrobacter sp. MYb227]|uniref:DEAD/DEAH box helicase n=1 Tax=Arthrobacter sp. MYb227 TaxID=1848601 RepID=UPI000CFAA720|nr:AAA domain-containing protein [Arthrobacter sp. MYb227]PQZ95983.1 hypothetical protein CQ018_01465 [Arthrobacter sp. MYb227]